MMKTHKIAVLPGDGIGKEVMPKAWNVLLAVAEKIGTFTLEGDQYPWGCEHFLETGIIMPQDGVETLRNYDAIYFVAGGHPDVIDYRSAWEFIFVIRKSFDQYINIRPIQNWENVPTLLANQEHEIDFVIVRENSEGEYAGPGGVVHGKLDHSMAVQTSVFTRTGVQRVAHFAFELARTRRKRVTNVTKSNAMRPSLVFWDDVMAEVSREYPDVEYETLYVDAATMKFIQKPSWFDVVVSTNLFGDILSDLAGAMIGSVGLSPSANIDPEHRFPSMFEPVHGSAPDIAGRGIANPIGTILAGALMLRHLGENDAYNLLYEAVAQVLKGDLRTGDLGGKATTKQIADAVIEKVQQLDLAKS